jgi:hypothetical protein
MRHAAQGGSHHGTDPVGVLSLWLQAGVGQRHPGCGNAELREAIEPAAAAFFHVVRCRKAVHLASDSGLEHRGVEPSDTANRRFASLKALPQPLDAEPDRRNRSNACNDNSSMVH